MKSTKMIEPLLLSEGNLAFLCELARDAGAAILKITDRSSLLKEDKSPLTLADLASHKCITEGLLKEFPQIPLISEEMSEQCSFEERQSWDTFWLVDPLDGTKEFIAGSDEFTVNIALIQNGTPVVGVIFVPKKNLLYYGSRDLGSYKSEDNQAPHQIFSEINTTNPVAVVSRSHLDEATKKFLIDNKISQSLSVGSSIKFCLLAEGKAHVYPRLSPIMEWDTAAGDAIFRYSGRSKPRVSPLRYNTLDLKFKGFVIGLE